MKQYIQPKTQQMKVELQQMVAGTGAVDSNGNFINMSNIQENGNANMAASRASKSVWDEE